MLRFSDVVSASEPMVMLSPALAPTWKVAAVKEPSSTFLPLNEVCLETRSTSSASCFTSACRASRSSSLLVALADCTASSRMRCSMSPTLPSAPSAVCASEMPSLALRAATFRPLTWAFMRSAMARPAASSLALLTRRPEDRRCMEVASEPCEDIRLRWAFIDITFVLMVVMTNS
ncbi:hypothetical protein FQZ97_672070 [compost metagenome]